MAAHLRRLRAAELRRQEDDGRKDCAALRETWRQRGAELMQLRGAHRQHAEALAKRGIEVGAHVAARLQADFDDNSKTLDAIRAVDFMLGWPFAALDLHTRTLPGGGTGYVLRVTLTWSDSFTPTRLIPDLAAFKRVVRSKLAQRRAEVDAMPGSALVDFRVVVVDD